MASNEDQLLTPEEAAQIVGCNVRELARMRSEGIGPDSVTLTKQTIRYDRADLEQWKRHGGEVR